MVVTNLSVVVDVVATADSVTGRVVAGLSVVVWEVVVTNLSVVVDVVETVDSVTGRVVAGLSVVVVVIV